MPARNGPVAAQAAAPRPGAHLGRAEAPADTLKGFTQRILIALLIIAQAFLLYRGVQVLLEAFAGVLLAVYLAAVSGWLSRRGLAYRWTLAIVVVVHAVIFAVGTYVLA